VRHKIAHVSGPIEIAESRQYLVFRRLVLPRLASLERLRLLLPPPTAFPPRARVKVNNGSDVEANYMYSSRVGLWR
jgi:hypothetical protein